MRKAAALAGAPGGLALIGVGKTGESALLTQNNMGCDSVVTTVFPDDNKKYLSTDLLREEPVKSSYLAPEVELISYEAIKRVCYTCFDGEE